MPDTSTRSRFAQNLRGTLHQVHHAWPFLRRHAWVAPVLALAAWLRFTNLGAEHLYGDEAEYAIVARYLSQDFWALHYPELSGMSGKVFVSQPPLVLYLMALSMRLLGPTDVAAILPSALLGVLTVAVVYGLACRLWGRFAGVAAALATALLPFHVDMSRKAMLDVGYVFFVLLTAYLLVAWLQARRQELPVREQRRAAVFTGAAAAGAALSKLPGVLVLPVLLVVFLAVLVVQLFRRTGVAETVRQGALGAAPVVIGGIGYLALLAQMNAVGALWSKLAWNLVRVGASEGSSSSGHGILYYFTHETQSLPAHIGHWTFVLAALGLALVLVRLLATRRLEDLVVPAVTVVLGAFFLLSDRKVGFYLLPFAPLAALLLIGGAATVRDGLQWALARWMPRLKSSVRVGIPMVIMALMVTPAVHAAATESYQEYSNYDGSSWGHGTREAGTWIAENDPGAGQYGTLLGRFSLRWYNEAPTYHWFVGEERLERAIRSGELEYIVFDEYLGLEYDTEYMRGVIAEHRGELVAEFERDGWARVEVYKLNPAPSPIAS